MHAIWEKWRPAGADLTLFFTAAEVPREDPKVYHRTFARDDEVRRREVANPYSLMRLAANPYMLFMLTQVYLVSGELPSNRAALFGQFVDVLLVREGLAEGMPGSPLRYTAEGEALLSGLGALAWMIQSRRERRRVEKDDGQTTDTLTVFPRSPAERLLAGLKRAASGSSLLTVDGREVRFSHQLLQEYFTALGMQKRLEAGQADAAAWWPSDRWWAPSGWEEVAVLLAGLYADDCSPVLFWLADTQPEVAARCIERSGASVPESTLQVLGTRWFPRLRDPSPAARAAIGRALGGVRMRGSLLDVRAGVGLRNGLPDIDWVEVRGSVFQYGDKRTKVSLDTFQIARYPVTNIQFKAFIDDPEGYANDCWWEGLAKRSEQSEPPRWNFANHPRETASWYEAMAFCRWLDARLRGRGDLTGGWQVRIPTEQEWEKAARGTDGREYPWGKFESGHANINETYEHAGPNYLRQTSAVGIYPGGASPYRALDMAGNVWEWCLNKYDKPADTSTGGDDKQVLRGGSWGFDRGSCRAPAATGTVPTTVTTTSAFGFVGVSPSAETLITE